MFLNMPTTRRKKPVVEGEETVVPDGTVAPKKHRVTHHSTVPPSETTGMGVPIPLQPHPAMPEATLSQPPVEAPRQHLEPFAPAPPVMPGHMKIEPASMPEESALPAVPRSPARIPVVEDHQVSDLWIPPPKDGNDLSAPPRILTAPKRLPQPEVEDVLAGTEHEHNDLMEFERPDLIRTQHSAHSGFFRKLGIGFTLVALAVLIFIGYITYAHATIIIHPKLVETKIERSIDVAAQPGDNAVGGETAEITVSGERSAAPGSAVAGSASSTSPTPAAPAADANATYVGVATLINKTAAPITLVPKTRLLTADGVLFRMKDRQTVPAGGTITVAIYADQPGHTGAIGPSKFTIPGLSVDQQAVIWAETKAATKAGGTASTTTVTPAAAPQVAVTQADLDALESGLKDELVTEAKAELAKKITGTWAGQTWIIEIMSKSPEPAVGDLVSQIDLKLTLRVRQVSFDRAKAVNLATAEIKRQLHSDQELVSVDGAGAQITADQIDPQAGSATLHVALTGETSISLSSPLFDAEKLQGLSLSAVKDYFNGIEGVDRIDVQFRPFWIKRMPDLKDHIDFQLAK